MWTRRRSPLRLDTKARVNSIASTAACLANHQSVISATCARQRRRYSNPSPSLLECLNDDLGINVGYQQTAGPGRITVDRAHSGTEPNGIRGVSPQGDGKSPCNW